jgi:integral membrane protein
MGLENVKRALKTLTIVGFVEGISFLLLIFIAMPLKYMLGLPTAVSWIGSIHGFLFLAYITVLIIVIYRLKLSFSYFFLGFIAAIIPFGPFVFDRYIKKKLHM